MLIVKKSKLKVLIYISMLIVGNNEADKVALVHIVFKPKFGIQPWVIARGLFGEFGMIWA